MTTTRTVTNAGAPLVGPDGTVLADTRVSFLLVDAKRRPIDVWDATTNERIVGRVDVDTDADGEFSVDLWPNSRGNKASKYLCTVDADGVADVLAVVPAGTGALSWAEFLVADEAMTAQDQTALEQHEASTTAHAASAITVTPAGGLASTNVQAALAELDTEKQPIDADLTGIAGLDPANGDVLLRAGGAWTAFPAADLPVDASSLVGATLAASVLAAALNAITPTGGTLDIDGDLTLGGVTVVTVDAVQTLTGKTIDLADNTLSGTLAQFNAALSGADFASLAGIETLTNKTISGASNTLSNIGNASLTNSSITIGSTSVSLGGTAATVAGLTLTSPTINGLPGGTGVATANTSSTLVARDASGNFSAGTITADLTGLASNSSQLLGSTWAAPAAIGSATPAAGTFTTIQATGDVVIDGNLLVSGDTITVNTSTVAVEDPLVKYASANVTDVVDMGFYALYQPAATPLYTGLFRDATDGKYKLFAALQEEPGTTVNVSGTGYSVASLVANVEGNLTGTVLTAAQPNITSLGTIDALVAGTVTTSGSVFVNANAGADFINGSSSGNVRLGWGTYGLGGGAIFGTDSNMPIIVAPNQVEVARYAYGAVSITGTHAVSGNATVGGTLGVTGVLNLGANATGGQAVNLGVDQAATTAMLVRNNTNNAAAYAGLILNASGNSWAWRMGSAAANSNTLELVVDALGTTPATKLSVTTAGAVAITGALSATDNFTITKSAGDSFVKLAQSGAGGRTYTLRSEATSGNFLLYDDTAGAARLTVSTSAITTALPLSVAGALSATGQPNFSGLPTSSAGLSAGDLWNDAGTVKVV